MEKKALHSIQPASAKDLNDVMDFLKEEWKANHIYFTNTDLFKYDYLFGEQLNFVIARNNDSNKIDAIIGFIKYTESYDNADAFTVLWKARKKSGNPTLGISILEFLVKKMNFRMVYTVGAKESSLPIYEFLEYPIGKLEHFYILNPEVKEFKIAMIKNKVESNIQHDKNSTFTLYKTFAEISFDFEKFKTRIPYKSPWWIERRYFNHPVYSYKIFGIENSSLLVAREIKVNDTKILRIVDFIGDENDLKNIGTALLQLMSENGYEYVDFLQFGIDGEILNVSGFILKKDDDENIIPNRFEPFEQKNVFLNFFTTTKEKFYFFKGDGDQDRPNQIQ